MNEDDLKKMTDENIEIVIPPKPGTILSVVFTWDLDMRSYFPYRWPNGQGHAEAREDAWGRELEWYIEEVDNFLHDYEYKEKHFLRLPQQARQGWYVYIPRPYLERKLKHIHLAWTDAPGSVRQRGGETIVVPAAPFPVHGPGKRQRN